MSTLAQGSPEDRAFEGRVEANADLVNAVPRKRFTRDEISPRLAEHLDSLRSKGIIDRAASETRDSDGEDDTSTYTVAVFEVVEEAVTIADRVTDTRDALCPCGHAGLRNCGDHYECKAEFCAREFARDELEVDT